MRDKIKDQVSDTLYRAILLMVNSLREVYRFSGEHTKVSTPNSVKDHIYSLYNLIDEVFECTPPEYDFIKKDMYMRATLHDCGEMLGELGVVETQVQGQGLTPEEKKDYEQIIFEYFITKAYESAVYKCTDLAFTELVHKLRRELDVKDLVKFKLTINKLKQYSTTFDMMPDIINIKKYYNHIENDLSYAGKLFKALDLIDGNEYYLKNAIDPHKVPESLHKKVKAYCLKVIYELRDAEKHNAKNYDDITNIVVERMLDNIKTYDSIVNI